MTRKTNSQTHHLVCVIFIFTHYKADSHFKKPFTPKKVYKNVLPDRTSLSPANYDVYLDGFPVNNPPVCLKDVPWAEYQKNPSIIDEYLRPFKVFGIAKYGPSKRFTGLDKGHIVIQFFYPESATNFLNTIRNKVCYGSVLTGMFFGEINPQDKGDYGYHGTTPFMGGLTKSKESNGNSRFFASDETTRKVVSDDNNGQSVKINVDFKKQRMCNNKLEYLHKKTLTRLTYFTKKI